MKKYLLSLLVCVGMLIITCGNEPPEGFYNGTPEDDSLIQSQLDNLPEFLNTIDQFIDSYIPISIAPVSFPVADSYFRADSPIVKQHIDSCALYLSDTNRYVDFWYAKDTTCTVYLYDTFNVVSLMHVDTIFTGHYDSLIIDTVKHDTIRLLKTLEIEHPTGSDAYTTEDIVGEGKRLIFLEPKRDTVVDSENGDTTYPIIEPWEWVLKRISYGIYYFPNSGGEHPSIYSAVIYRSAVDEVDTIIVSSYDTTYTGHAMDRLRSPDSLLTFAPGETLLVLLTIYGNFTANDCVFFVSCGGKNRTQLGSNGSGEVVIDPSLSGIQNLYIEVITQDSYYYVTPNKGYQAIVWLIPIKVE